MGRAVACAFVSTPPFLDLPEHVTPTRLPTPRGDLAGLSATPHDPPTGEPVLLVPGFTGSKEDFLPILSAIRAAGHPVLAIDLRGQYESAGDEAPSSYDVAALAEDVLAVAAGLGRPVHLLGHSFGGLVVRAAALADPSAVRSLTLLCSGPSSIPPPSADGVEQLVGVLGRVDLETIWSVKRGRELVEENPVPPHIEEFLHSRFVRNHPVGLRRMAEQLLSEPDRVEELAKLGLPMLVVFGTRDDAWPPSVQTDMAARLGAQVVEIADAGHSPAVEAPGETVRALLDFWDRTQGRPSRS